METLDDQRDDLIARIKTAFPKIPPTQSANKPSFNFGKGYYGGELKTLLKGKFWEEVVDEQSIVYVLTEFEYLDHMLEADYKVFLYYFPASLLKTTHDPDWWMYYDPILEYLFTLRESFSVEQLE